LVRRGRHVGAVHGRSGGFRDGWHGLVYAYVRANYVRQKTIMLWMLGNGQAVADPVAPAERS